VRLLASIINGLAKSPRLVDQLAAEGLSIGADLAARMQQRMIDTAPDRLGTRAPTPPSIPAVLEAYMQARARMSPTNETEVPARHVHVEVVTVDPSKLSNRRGTK